MDQVSQWIEQRTQLNPDIIWKLVISALIVLGLLLLRMIAIRLAYRRIDDEDVKARYTWRNSINNTYYVIVVLIISIYWLENIGSVATFLGLFSAGLAIALKDPLVNFAGWLFIVIRKPLKLGDRIQIGDHAGDVIDIRFFQFTINEINNWVDADQSTGRIIHIPNGTVFLHPQANYNQGFSHIWNEINVLITFESNWNKAKEILEEIVVDHAEQFSFSARKKLIEASKKYMIFYRTLTPIVYLKVIESGVQLTMRYLIDPRKRRSSEHNIWTDVLKAFHDAEDIEFAYPTQRIFFNPQEDKRHSDDPTGGSGDQK
jgi:small-conductance mechanosensitive channel